MAAERRMGKGIIKRFTSSELGTQKSPYVVESLGSEDRGIECMGLVVRGISREGGAAYVTNNQDGGSKYLVRRSFWNRNKVIINQTRFGFTRDGSHDTARDAQDFWNSKLRDERHAAEDAEERARIADATREIRRSHLSSKLDGFH